jgi:uncharacterized protein (DUF2336 family)
MTSTKLYDLIELAKEPSSERRRELLREVTDLFLAQAPSKLDPGQIALFDDVMGRITSEMEEVVRAELSEKLAPSAVAPPQVLRDLAGDSAAVAAPILRTSTALSEAELVELARTKGQAHLRAISQRAEVPIAVSDAIIERADDATLGVLLRNEGAELSREGSETAVDRAHANPALHEAVVHRRSLPPDLLNEMYFIVEARLREKIMERNAELDPQELEAALASGRKRLAARDGAVPPDYQQAEADVKAMAKAGELTPTVLTSLLRRGEKTRFMIALAELADIDFATARRILEQRLVDPLAIICKAADFERALFLTFVVLMLDRDANAMGRAQEYGDLYAKLTREAASRAIRFWRIRRQTGDLAAA